MKTIFMIAMTTGLLASCTSNEKEINLKSKLKQTKPAKGFTLKRIKKDSIYRKFGLEKGDTITEINGKKLETPKKAIDILNDASGQKKLKARIARDGEIKTITTKVE